MRLIEKVTYGTEVPKPGTADDILFVDVDQSKCIGCKNCTHVCPTGAIRSTDPSKRWSPVHIPYPLLCIYCGQCLVNCPVNAIYERVSFVDEIRKAIADPGKIVVALPAPSIRYALGEEFGMPDGSFVGPKMFSALRKLGFDTVYDVEFGADVTIMEEGTELIGRISGKLKRPLPQFTSCCPGWIRYVETYYPEIISHLSSTKTPAQILGVIAKTWGAEKMGADMKNIYTVAIMPCVSKKFEGLRKEYSVNGSSLPDIDATIDTREISFMIKDAGIDFASLPDSKADDLLGLSTGAATIFGVTGGVMEAMLRLLAEKLDGRNIENVEFTQVRGQKAVREAVITAGGKDIKVAIVSGLKNAKPICEQVKAGKSPYVAIEVMACPGGCVNGGGQPYADWSKRAEVSFLLRVRRMLLDLAGESEQA
jgi:ferredoxin hydrogenase large subunit